MTLQILALLQAIIISIPATIASFAAYRRLGKQAGKLEDIHKQVNGNLVEEKVRNDFLATRLSSYEELPPRYGDNDARNLEPGGCNRRGSDAGGSDCEQGGNENPV